MSGRKDFLNQPAPENYVAGLGRGATGFTTRSDLGPAREGPSEEQIKEALAKRAATLGTAAPTAYGVPERKDDDEADRIYQDVDEKMDRRRKLRRFVFPFIPDNFCPFYCTGLFINPFWVWIDYRRKFVST